MTVVTTICPTQNIPTKLGAPAVIYDNLFESEAVQSLHILACATGVRAKDACELILEASDMTHLNMIESIDFDADYQLFIFNDFSAILCKTDSSAKTKAFYLPLRVTQNATAKGSKIQMTIRNRQAFLMHFLTNSDLRAAVIADIASIQAFWDANPCFDTNAPDTVPTRLVWCLPNTAMAGFEAAFDNEVWAAVATFEATTSSQVSHVVIQLRSFDLAGHATPITCKALAKFGPNVGHGDLEFYIQAQMENNPLLPVVRQLAPLTHDVEVSRRMRFIDTMQCNSHDIIRAHRRIMAAKEADTNLRSRKLQNTTGS